MLLNFLPPIISTSVVAPSITDQPDTIEVYEGQTATFTVAATGGGLTYQWQRSDNAGVDWSNISGATSNSYTTAAAVRTTDNDDQFRCVVTNSAGDANSNAAILTVWNPLALGADLACWLDPTSGVFTQRTGSSASTAATNGDPVGTWRAKNGTINGTAGSDTQRGILRTTGLNGTPCVEFDGTDDRYDFTTDLATVFKNKSYGYMFIAAASEAEASAAVALIFATNSASVSRASLNFNFLSTSGTSAVALRRLDGDSAATATAAATITSNVAAIWGCEFLWGVSDLHLRKNGTRIASNTSAGTNGATSNTNSANVTLGGNGTGFLPFDGFIGHVVVTCPTAEHDSTTIAKIEGYLNYKSGSIY